MSRVSRSELKKRSKDSKKLYCGDQEELPKGYWNFGTRSQCTRKGVGIGMYVIPKQKSISRKSKSKERKKAKSKLRSKKKKTLDDLYEEEEMDEEDEADRIDNLENKDVYKDFLEDNFKEALKDSSNLEFGDVFKRLAAMWKDEQMTAKREYNERRKERRKDMRNLD